MTNTAQVNHRSQVQPKRRIRNLLIDRKFQLRWVIRIIFIITLIVFAMGYFLYRTVADATDQMLAQKLGDMELTEASIRAFVRQAESDKVMTVYTLMAWLGTLAVFVSAATIVLTHKVAGPVYKMRKVFHSINGGNLNFQEKLRRGDELRDAFDDFDDMLRRLREERRSELKTLTEIRGAMDKKEDLSSAEAKIDTLIEKFTDSVRIDSSGP